MKKSLLHPMLAAIITLLSVSACSDNTTAPSPSSVSENTLVFTRADQSKMTFVNGSQLVAWCGPWETGLIPTPAVHIRFSGPSARDPGWTLTAVVADVKIGTPLTFPNDFIFDNPKKADLFILDYPNELSTTRPQSSGSVTFQQLNCTTGGRVEFSIAATVGSEFSNGPSVSVAGKVNAAIGAAPQ